MKKIFFLILTILNTNFLSSQERTIKNLYGFGTNTTFMFNDIKDTSFLSNVNIISPRLLAFPGGLGNFYHLSGMGYGIKISEVDFFHKGKLPKRIRGINKIIEKNKHENYIYPFIDLSKKLKSDVIIDANILSAEIDETIQIINLILKNGINVSYVEIGRELTNQSYHENFDIYKYLEKSKALTERIRVAFPNIKIGVVAAPIYKSYVKHVNWNKLLSKENFYDAIVVHTYAKVTKGKDEYGKMVTEYPEGKNKYQAFNIYKKRSLDFFKEYPKEINDYSQMFQNKDIWITEWNLQVSKLTGKTHIQSLFVFCYLMEVACNEELRKINLMSFHNLAGRDISSSVIINREKSSLSTTFAAFKLLSDIFVNDRITVVSRSFTNEFFEYEFLSEKNEKFFVCINWSERPKKVDISEYDYSKIYYSENLYDNQYYSENFSSNEVNLKELEIPKYSFCIFKSGKNK